MSSQRRPGRPSGGSDTRAQILAAARAEFAERGFDRTTMREIARVAGVDSALVHHYFGTKQRIFIACVQLPIDPSEIVGSILTGPRADLGTSLARMFLGVYEDEAARASVLALLRTAMVQEQTAAMMREFLTSTVLEIVGAALDLPPDDARLRLELAVSHLLGVVITRYVIEIEPIASATTDELVCRIGPVIQHYFD